MIAFILGGILVPLCCVFVDRRVAWYVESHRSYSDAFLQRSLLVSGWLTCLVVVGVAGVVAWRLWRPGGKFQTLLLAIAANLVATEGITSLLKWVFGRTGTWIVKLPASTPDGVYGFHPFGVGGGGQSFPSGHTAATCAVISILWLTRPRWRWLYAIVGGLVCVALVALNYHYLSDVLAGAMLGWATGSCATRLFRLQTVTADQSGPDLAVVRCDLEHFKSPHPLPLSQRERGVSG
jgi:membrane-associated phospholipid phosphatase